MSIVLTVIFVFGCMVINNVLFAAESENTKNIIGKVTITGIVEPKAGEKPIVEGLKVAEEDSCVINVKEWKIYDDKSKQAVKMDEGAKYEVGKSYVLALQIEPKGSYEFSYDTKVTVNDKDAELDLFAETKTGYVEYKYHIPTPEESKKDFRGTIQWLDSLNQDGIRPEEVKLTLYKGNEETNFTTISKETKGKTGRWVFTFKDVPTVDESGNLIKYIVKQEAVEGYNTTYKDFDILNKHETAKKTIVVKIKWNDDNNIKGKRPEKVNLHLLEDNDPAYKEAYILDKNSDITIIKLEDLDVNRRGNLINYSVKQQEVDGYETEYVVEGDVIIVTNTLKSGFDSENINEPPTLELKDIIIKQGENFNPFDLVVSAKDKEDGDLIKDVKIVDNGGFDKAKAGKYIFTFKLTDKDGAEVVKKALVTVAENDEGGKVDNKFRDSSKSKFSHDSNTSLKRKVSPKTGDGINLPIYIILLGTSVVFFTVVGFGKRRKES